MLNKPLNNITESDVLLLKEQKVEEGKKIDYKQDVYGASDNEKKELLADVSSFVNTEGGDLLIGVEEKNGISISVEGVKLKNPDSKILRIENIIRNGLDPRVLVSTKAIPYVRWRW